MNGIPTLYINQYGAIVWAKSARELQRKHGGRLNKMYRDKKDGRTVHVGYVVGKLWLDAYRPVELPAGGNNVQTG